jgi:hypothetical protein
MAEDSWEHRMARRAAERLDTERLAEYVANGGKVYQSADEVWADHPDACRDCNEPRFAPNTFYRWQMWAWVCGGPPAGCDHAHHDDEVAVGDYGGYGWAP